MGISKRNKKLVFVGIAAVVIIGVLFLIFNLSSKKDNNITANGDLKINKSEVTSNNVKFYPYNIDGKNIELLAVKASDNTIRVAFNTCQVCNGSPKAYYKQEGQQLVCQNCGNKFSFDMVGQTRGGCNPVPIPSSSIKDDGQTLIISKDFIANNSELFSSNWKTQ